MTSVMGAPQVSHSVLPLGNRNPCGTTTSPPTLVTEKSTRDSSRVRSPGRPSTVDVASAPVAIARAAVCRFSRGGGDGGNEGLCPKKGGG